MNTLKEQQSELQKEKSALEKSKLGADQNKDKQNKLYETLKIQLTNLQAKEKDLENRLKKIDQKEKDLREMEEQILKSKSIKEQKEPSRPLSRDMENAALKVDILKKHIQEIAQLTKAKISDSERLSAITENLKRLQRSWDAQIQKQKQ